MFNQTDLQRNLSREDRFEDDTVNVYSNTLIK